jgi:hypothetical protein
MIADVLNMRDSPTFWRVRVMLIDDRNRSGHQDARPGGHLSDHPGGDFQILGGFGLGCPAARRRLGVGMKAGPPIRGNDRTVDRRSEKPFTGEVFRLATVTENFAEGAGRDRDLSRSLLVGDSLAPVSDGRWGCVRSEPYSGAGQLHYTSNRQD